MPLQVFQVQLDVDIRVGELPPTKSQKDWRHMMPITDRANANTITGQPSKIDHDSNSPTSVCRLKPRR